MRQTATRSTKRHRPLYRSTDDRVIMGVCGGIAERFDFNPLGVRILFIVLCLTGVGLPLMLLGYIALGFTLKPAPTAALDSAGGEDLWRAYRSSRLDALREVQRRFDRLEERLRRMESIVTDPRFAIEEEYRRL
jgi:phage shock protein C